MVVVVVVVGCLVAFLISGTFYGLEVGGWGFCLFKNSDLNSWMIYHIRWWHGINYAIAGRRVGESLILLLFLNESLIDFVCVYDEMKYVWRMFAKFVLWAFSNMKPSIICFDFVFHYKFDFWSHNGYTVCA